MYQSLFSRQTFWKLLIVPLSLLLFLGVVDNSIPVVEAASIVVDTVNDADPGLPSQDGFCSLREAIIAANTDTAVDSCAAGSGADVITFNIPGAGVKTIDASGRFFVYEITEALEINGYSQGGSAGILVNGTPHDIRVFINGPASDIVDTFQVNNTSNVTISGLAIVGGRNRVEVSNSSNVTIANNYIGTDAGGNAAAGHVHNGVDVSDSSSVFVRNNLLAGNGVEHIVLHHTDNSQVQGNLVGVNQNGSAVLGSIADHGIFLSGDSNNNLVGGPNLTDRNVVANTLKGIHIFTNVASGNNTIQGNYVGLDVTGLIGLGNGDVGFDSAGIELCNGTSNIISDNVVGSTTNGCGINFDPGTLITGTLVSDNIIGTDLSLNMSLGNQTGGICFNGQNTGDTENTTITTNTIVNTTDGPGIHSDDRQNICLSQNSIANNSGLGMDAQAPGPIVDLNDAGDISLPPNYPIIDTADVDASGLTITGWAEPGTVIEFFVSDDDPTGFGEGAAYIARCQEGGTIDGITDTDATVSTYGPAPINGLAQGTDNTNRYSCVIPFAGMTNVPQPGTNTITAHGSDTTPPVCETSEFAGQAPVGAEQDLGDLPDTSNGTGTQDYQTLVANAGASHLIVPNVYLGNGVDDDGNTDQQDINAGLTGGGDAADGNNDDDGVSFSTPVQANQQATMNVQVGPAGGFLSCFMDFDGNGSLDDITLDLVGGGAPSQSAFNNYPVGSGNTVFVFTAPANTNAASLYYRCRLTETAGEIAGPNGFAKSGEVEDYVLMSLGGTVFGDDGTGGGTANSGTQNGSEPGIAGVAMALLNSTCTAPITDSAGAPIVTTTDSNGNYLFTGLTPSNGDYCVQVASSNFDSDSVLETLRSSDDIGSSSNPNNDTNSDDNGVGGQATNPVGVGVTTNPANSVVLTYGGEPDTGTDGNEQNSNLTIDFGFVNTTGVCIGNIVWADDDGDGTSLGDAGIPDVTLNLYASGSTPGVTVPVDTATTDANGFYRFCGVAPGTYFVGLDTNSTGVLVGGFTGSSTGGDHNPDTTGDDNTVSGDDGVNGANDYLVTQEFVVAVNGQSNTSDLNDIPGYTDASSYMTIDFGLTSSPVAVVFAGLSLAMGNGGMNVFAIIALILSALTAFAYHRREAMA